VSQHGLRKDHTVISLAENKNRSNFPNQKGLFTDMKEGRDYERGKR
jgi:hypothetical protein